MRKSIRAFVLAAATLAVVSTSFAPANATHKVGHVVGAFAAGALIGGLLAQPRPVYGQPVYVQPAPVYVQPVCRWQNTRIWDPYIGAYVIRRQRVCG